MQLLRTHDDRARRRGHEALLLQAAREGVEGVRVRHDHVGAEGFHLAQEIGSRRVAEAEGAQDTPAVEPVIEARLEPCPERPAGRGSFPTSGAAVSRGPRPPRSSPGRSRPSACRGCEHRARSEAGRPSSPPSPSESDAGPGPLRGSRHSGRGTSRDRQPATGGSHREPAALPARGRSSRQRLTVVAAVVACMNQQLAQRREAPLLQFGATRATGWPRAPPSSRTCERPFSTPSKARISSGELARAGGPLASLQPPKDSPSALTCGPRSIQVA